MIGLKKNRSVIKALLIVLSLLIIFGAQSIAGGVASQHISDDPTPKHETIFANLDHNGNVSKMFAVNTFVNPDDTIVDYGDYSTILNLTDESLPEIDGDRIFFDAVANEKVFRYQGALEGRQLPWSFSISYYLNGSAVEAKNLAGVTGKLRIEIDVRQNPDVHLYFNENFMLQVSVPLHMDKASAIDAPDATIMYAGNIATVAFAVMQQNDTVLYLEAYVRDFEMDGINIAAMKATVPENDMIDDLESGFADMADGTQELIDGTGEFVQGMVELNDGVGGIYSGAAEIAWGTRNLSGGMGDITNGFRQVTNGMEEIGAGAEGFNEALSKMSAAMPQLVGGYKGIEGGINSLLVNKDQLSALAVNLAQNPDPQVRMLSEAMLMQLGALSEVHGGLKSTNEGLSAQSGALSEIATQFAEFNQGMQKSVEGAKELERGLNEINTATGKLSGGATALRNGIGKLYENTQALPQEVEKLKEGQQELRDGILQVKDEILEFTGESQEVDAVSFVSPLRANAQTVQFVLRTPPIEAVVEQWEEISAERAENIWDRFLNLFRHIADRLFS